MKWQQYHYWVTKKKKKKSLHKSFLQKRLFPHGLQLPPIILSILLLSLVTFQKAFLYMEKSLKNINSRTNPHNSGRNNFFSKFNSLIFVIWGFRKKKDDNRPNRKTQTHKTSNQTKKDNLKNLLKEGFEYSVVTFLKASIESGDKTLQRSQFRTVILMTDTIISKETQLCFAKGNVLQ